MQDLVLAAVLVVCAITDIKNRKIYNVVIFPFLLFALLYNLRTGGLSGLSESLLGMGLGLAILFIPFAMGGMGGGDVKLLALVGAFKGTSFVGVAAIGMALFGGVMALIVLVYRRRFLQTMASIFRAFWIMLKSGFAIRSFNHIDESEQTMLPFGLAIALGSAGALWLTR